jgi:hypothetical protein
LYPGFVESLSCLKEATGILTMKRLLFFILSIPIILISCNENKNPVKPDNDFTVNNTFQVSVLKWYDGHKAAVSITYDSSWCANEKVIQVANAVTDRKMHMDFEVVTATFNKPEKLFRVTQMREQLIPQGIHFYGHGHEHVNHDKLDFEAAYNSFKLCYNLMDEWGLEPKAYGYPGSSGYKPSTQLAVKLAGFICARGVTVSPDSFYICPDEKKEPLNWFYLP